MTTEQTITLTLTPDEFKALAAGYAATRFALEEGYSPLAALSASIVAASPAAVLGSVADKLRVATRQFAQLEPAEEEAA